MTPPPLLLMQDPESPPPLALPPDAWPKRRVRIPRVFGIIVWFGELIVAREFHFGVWGHTVGTLGVAAFMLFLWLWNGPRSKRSPSRPRAVKS